MTAGTERSTDNGEGLSLAELVSRLQYYTGIILRNWLLVGIAIFIGVGCSVALSMRTPVTYPTKLTFMVNEEEGGGGSSSLLRIAGGLLGGKSGGTNLDRITALALSDRILRNVLFNEVVVSGKEDYLANHVIREQGLHDKWAESSNTAIHGFLFTTDTITADQLVAKSALKGTMGAVRGNARTPGILSVVYNEDSQILSINCNSLNEDLSVLLPIQLFEELSAYYITRTIEPQRTTYETIKFKVDSLEAAMFSVVGELARAKDQNLYVNSQAGRLREGRLFMEQRKLQAILEEAVKNLETAEFLLKNATPFFQLIDTPYSPVQANEQSTLRAVVTGAGVALLLACAFIILRQMVRDENQQRSIT